MFWKTFTLALLGAATSYAKQGFGKYYVDYKHGSEKPTEEYL